MKSVRLFFALVSFFLQRFYSRGIFRTCDRIQLDLDPILLVWRTLCLRAADPRPVKITCFSSPYFFPGQNRTDGVCPDGEIFPFIIFFRSRRDLRRFKIYSYSYFLACIIILLFIVNICVFVQIVKHFWIISGVFVCFCFIAGVFLGLCFFRTTCGPYLPHFRFHFLSIFSTPNLLRPRLLSDTQKATN